MKNGKWKIENGKLKMENEGSSDKTSLRACPSSRT